jgi:hypothetical protein
MKSTWGRGIGITFVDDEEYYFTLGYLANYKKHPISIYTHKNQNSGAWGGQGKLEVPKYLDQARLPRPLRYAFSQSGDHRLSVSDYVDQLCLRHGFSAAIDRTGKNYTFHRFPQSFEAVESTVPEKYKIAFRAGYDS